MDGSSLTVVCVLWVGDFRRRTYNPDWVIRLKSMISRRLSIPHDFVCLSNVEIPNINIIKINNDLPGWWAKINLFKPGILSGRILYLDLDSILFGNWDEVVGKPGRYVPAPHSSYWRGEGIDTRSGVVRNTCSCCLIWDAGECDKIWNTFHSNVMKKFRGDQDWIGHVMGPQPTLPPEWFLKLRQCQDGPPKGVKMVACMPWKNDVAARLFNWVADAWQ